jgi:DNA invertase Pin-like site-specific DNA recombinase
MTSMRLLGVVRLSRDTDETTSPERQREAITAYAERKGHRIIGWAEDLDVSGKIEPEKRPGLGPWLRRMDEWDGLIVHKHDRMGRDLRHFLNLIHELKQQGKVFMSIEPEIDMTTREGKMIANALFSSAEYELDMIEKRTKESYRYIKANSGYPGGQVPFGYRPVKNGKGWTYEPDPEYAPIVREMINRVFAGTSMRQVALWLNAEGIPTSRNVVRLRQGKPEQPSRWTTQAVKEVLTSPSIVGMHTRDGRPLQDSDGATVQRCEGIIDRRTWELVKSAVAGAPHRAHRVDANPLLQIAFCGLCESPLYAHTSPPSKNNTYRYYRCAKRHSTGECTLRSVPADWLEGEAEAKFLIGFAEMERGHWDIEPAEDHVQDLREVQQLIDELDAEYRTGGLNARAYTRQINALEARREALEALPVKPERRTWVGTGETYGERWVRLSEAEKVSEWRETGFSFNVVPKRDGGFEVLGWGSRWPESLRGPSAKAEDS